MSYTDHDKYGMYKNSGSEGPGPALMGADTLIGDNVVNGADENLGEITEIMIDMDSGQVAYAVLSFGGFLGLGEKLFAVPWQALDLDTVNKRFVLNVDKDRLKSAPGFDPDRWPDMSEVGWSNQIHSFYGTDPTMGGRAGMGARSMAGAGSGMGSSAGASMGSAAGSGSSMGAGTSAGSGTSTGTGAGMGSGTSGTSTGTSTGAGSASGTGSGSSTGTSSGAGMGSGAGSGSSMGTGAGSGSSSDLGKGTGSGTGTGSTPGSDSSSGAGTSGGSRGDNI
jgi:sporulation protein YlmC with PRC-barrel domain